MCVPCVVCCGELLCVCRYVLCWCWCWCGNVWCVCRYVCNVWCVCGVVCVLSVWRGLARGKPPVCRLKTSPCVGSKRIRVYRQNARMLNTCGRSAGTHGCVLNLHTETFLTTHGEEGRGGGVVVFSSLTFSLPSLSLFRRSFSLLSFPLLSSLSSLSNNDNDHSSSRALSVHTWL